MRKFLACVLCMCVFFGLVGLSQEKDLMARTIHVPLPGLGEVTVTGELLASGSLYCVLGVVFLILFSSFLSTCASSASQKPDVEDLEDLDFNPFTLADHVKLLDPSGAADFIRKVADNSEEATCVVAARILEQLPVETRLKILDKLCEKWEGETTRIDVFNAMRGVGTQGVSPSLSSGGS